MTTLSDSMPWGYVKDANHTTSEGYAAEYNARKAARKAKEAAKVEPKAVVVEAAPAVVEAPKPARKPLVVSLSIEINGSVYSVQRNPGTGSIRLVKQDADGAVYDVERTASGLVTCNCPSYTKRFEGTVSTCKHGAAMVEVGLLAAPEWIVPADVEPITQRMIDSIITARPADRTIGDDVREAATVAVVAPEIVEPETSSKPRLAGLGDVLDAMEGLPRSIASVAKTVGCHWTSARKAILGRFPVNGAIVPLSGYDFAPKPEMTEDSPEDEGSFADELLEVLPPLDSPSDADEDRYEGLDNSADPIGWPKPARRSYLIPAPARPVKPSAIPDGKYTLVGLVEAQIALLRGQESAVHSMMADRLDQLAREIRHSGATSVAEFTDRLDAMEDGYLDRIRIAAYDAGYQAAMQEAGCLV